MKRIRSLPAMLIALTTLALTGAPAFASTVDTVLFNATDNVELDGDQAPGLGTNFVASSPVNVAERPEDAFGDVSGLFGPSVFITANPSMVDNGNATFDPGSETIDSISWETTSVVVIDGYRLSVNGDGATSTDNRDTELARLSVEGEIDDQFDNGGANGNFERLFAIPQVGNNFLYEYTHTTGVGARVSEIDALVTDTTSAVINETIFNSTNNGVGEQAIGLSTNFVTSSTRNGTSDVEAAFGGTNSSPGGAAFLFEDLGAGTLAGLTLANADNGNNLFGDGVELVDSIEWSTTSLIQLDGYAINLGPDGNNENANRASELVRFYVEGVLVDIFDANGHGGVFKRLFEAGTLVGNDFRIEFTRHINGGPRIVEIDALNAFAVPTPAALPAGVALLMFAAMHRRSASSMAGRK